MQNIPREIQIYEMTKSHGAVGQWGGEVLAKAIACSFCM
jgi:hypothetical protein